MQGSAPFKDLDVYDKLEVIMLYLGETDEAQEGILRLLEVLLSDTRTVAERKQILEVEYGIKMTEEIEGGVDRMCNISIGIAKENYERGLDYGIKRGREEGIAQGQAQGEFKMKKQTAINLARMNMNVDMIATALEEDRTMIMSWLKEA